MTSTDGLLIAERSYSDDESKLSVGLANIHAAVPDIEANRDKILRAVEIFKQRGVNIAVFPEFCLSGYFWDAREDCLAYMLEAVSEQHTDWIERELQPLIGGDLEAIVLNNLTAGNAGGLLSEPHVRRRPRPRLPGRRAHVRQGLPAGHREAVHRERA